jgi:copper transport protein
VARALAVLVLAALVAPASASAHARLVRTSPADGAVLARAPQQVLVVFDDTVRVASGNAAVANLSQRSVLAGRAVARGRALVLPLQRRLARGDYTVRWSIVSEDGHPEQGVLAFAVGRGAPPPHPVLVASAPLRIRDVALRALYYLGLLTAAGAAVFALRARHVLGARLHRPLAGLLFCALLAAFLGASGLDATASSGTRFALVLEIALIVAGVGAAAAALAPAYPALLTAAGGCALALLVAPALSGHALDPDQPRVLAPALDVVHTAAAAVWLGGLIAVFWIPARAHADARERRAVLRRFSSAALAAVALLAASGVGRALTELGAVHQLWTTSYGRTLLVKTALFLPLLAVGRVNRSLLERARPLPARSVAAEILAIAAIVVVVAVLTELRPARETRRPLARVAGGRGIVVGGPVALRFAPDGLEEAGRVLEGGQP